MLKVLKQGLLKKGVVTTNYPAEPFTPGAGYLGLPAVDAALCDKCARCAAACPSGAITVADAVEISAGRCIFCAACRDACPRGAIAMTGRFELAYKEETKVSR